MPVVCLCTDTFIQKTRKLYLDTSNQRNIQKLNDELIEVQQIMTRNIEEVLGVGEKLDRKCSTRTVPQKRKDQARHTCSFQLAHPVQCPACCSVCDGLPCTAIAVSYAESCVVS